MKLEVNLYYINVQQKIVHFPILALTRINWIFICFQN